MAKSLYVKTQSLLRLKNVHEPFFFREKRKFQFPLFSFIKYIIILMNEG